MCCNLLNSLIWSLLWRKAIYEDSMVRRMEPWVSGSILFIFIKKSDYQLKSQRHEVFYKAGEECSQVLSALRREKLFICKYSSNNLFYCLETFSILQGAILRNELNQMTLFMLWRNLKIKRFFVSQNLLLTASMVNVLCPLKRNIFH